MGSRSISALRRTLRAQSLPVWDDTTTDPDAEHGPNEAIPDGFTVCDEQSANWVVRKVNECRLRATRAEAWAASEIRAAQRDEGFFLQRYGQQLERWAAGEIDEFKGRRKSLNLPGGTVGFRTEASKLIVTDERLLLNWCRSNLPGAFRLTVQACGQAALQLRQWQQSQCPDAQVEEHVVKSAVNDHFAENGDLPAGTELIGAGQKFYIK